MNMRLLVPSPFPSGVDAGLSCSLTLVTSYGPLATVEPSVTAARSPGLACDWPVVNNLITRRRTEPASFRRFPALAAVPEVGGRADPEADRVERRGAAVAGRRLGEEADPGARRPAQAGVGQQLPVGAVFRRVERPRPAGPGDAEPERGARGRERVAVVGDAMRDDGHRGRAALRRELVAELGPAAIGQVDQQHPGVEDLAELHRDPGGEGEVLVAGEAGQPAGVRPRALVPYRVDEHVRLGPAGQYQRAPRDDRLADRGPGGLKGKGEAGHIQIGHGGSVPQTRAVSPVTPTG